MTARSIVLAVALVATAPVVICALVCAFVLNLPWSVMSWWARGVDRLLPLSWTARIAFGIGATAYLLGWTEKRANMESILADAETARARDREEVPKR